VGFQPGAHPGIVIGGEPLSIGPDIEQEAILAGEEVLNPQDQAAERSIQEQMDTMYQRDRWMAIATVVAMLIVLPFVYVVLLENMPGTGTKVVLAVSGIVLLVYNVASMLALVRNYRRDKDFIYRRDVAHLRELAVARRAARGRS
jgi:archaellum biogenesis protein FlaJ (TadC family)